MTNPIILKTKIVRTPRTLQLESMFDLKKSEESIVELFPFPIEKLKEKDWSIGMIVGPSGSGKTQTAKHTFGDYIQNEFKWDTEKSIIDNMPKEVGIKEIIDVLSSVGFSTPPAWLRPFHLLSNGEKFRVEIARTLLENKDINIIDEFTSVVDRQVAQVASYSVQKAVRKRKQKLIAISCHYDIEEWLQPDWIFNPATGEFRWGSLCQRPKIQIEFKTGKKEDWNQFSRHHYLSSIMPFNARIIVAYINKQPVALIGACAFFSGTVKNAWRIARVVVLPDYQGLGLGSIINDAMASALKACGKKVYITTAHPGFVKSLNKSKNWAMNRSLSLNNMHTNIKMRRTSAWDRMTAGFVYLGKADKKFGKLIEGGKLVMKI